MSDPYTRLGLDIVRIRPASLDGVGFSLNVSVAGDEQGEARFVSPGELQRAADNPDHREAHGQAVWLDLRGLLPRIAAEPWEAVAANRGLNALARIAPVPLLRPPQPVFSVAILLFPFSQPRVRHAASAARWLKDTYRSHTTLVDVSAGLAPTEFLLRGEDGRLLGARRPSFRFDAVHVFLDQTSPHLDSEGLIPTAANVASIADRLGAHTVLVTDGGESRASSNAVALADSVARLRPGSTCVIPSIALRHPGTPQADPAGFEKSADWWDPTAPAPNDWAWVRYLTPIELWVWLKDNRPDAISTARVRTTQSQQQYSPDQLMWRAAAERCRERWSSFALLAGEGRTGRAVAIAIRAATRDLDAAIDPDAVIDPGDAWF